MPPLATTLTDTWDHLQKWWGAFSDTALSELQCKLPSEDSILPDVVLQPKLQTEEILHGLQVSAERLQKLIQSDVSPIIKTLQDGLFAVEIEVPLVAGEYEQDVWVEAGTTATVKAYLYDVAWEHSEGLNQEQILEKLHASNDNKIYLDIQFSKPIRKKDHFAWFDVKMHRLQWFDNGKIYAFPEVVGFKIAPQDITTMMSKILLGVEQETFQLNLNELPSLLEKVREQLPDGLPGEFVYVLGSSGCGDIKMHKWVRRLSYMPNLADLKYQLRTNWMVDLLNDLKVPVQMKHYQSYPALTGQGLDFTKPGHTQIILQNMKIAPGLAIQGLNAQISWVPSTDGLHIKIDFLTMDSILLNEPSYACIHHPIVVKNLEISNVEFVWDMFATKLVSTSPLTAKIKMKELSWLNAVSLKDIAVDIIVDPIAKRYQARHLQFMMNHAQVLNGKFEVMMGESWIEDANLDLQRKDDDWKLAFSFSPNFDLQTLNVETLLGLRNIYGACALVDGEVSLKKEFSVSLVDCNIHAYTTQELSRNNFLNLEKFDASLGYGELLKKQDQLEITFAQAHYDIEGLLQKQFELLMESMGGFELFHWKNGGKEYQLELQNYYSYGTTHYRGAELDTTLNLDGNLMLGDVKLGQNAAQGFTTDFNNLILQGIFELAHGPDSASYHGNAGIEVMRSKVQEGVVDLYTYGLHAQGLSTFFNRRKGKLSYDGVVSLQQGDIHLPQGMDRWSGILQDFKLLGLLEFFKRPFAGFLQLNSSMGEAIMSPYKKSGHRLVWSDWASIHAKGVVRKGKGNSKIKLYPGLDTKIKELAFGKNFLMANIRGKLMGEFAPNGWNPNSSVRLFDEKGKDRLFRFNCKRYGKIRFDSGLYLGDDFCKLEAK